MPDLDAAPLAQRVGAMALDRRTLLVGAAGAVAAARLGPPALAEGRRFDAALARRLRGVLHDALKGADPHAPGAILHVRDLRSSWTGAAGLARVTPASRMRSHDRFRAGSIVKPFVATVVLQLAEAGRLSLDDRLPSLLPADVVGRFPAAGEVTARMLLNHRSGIPEWDSPALDVEIAAHPAKVWSVAELLDLAAAKPQVFAPGTSYSYSNTDYTLLGLVIERLTGVSWRRAVTRRVFTPLALTQTSLPRPGNRSIGGPHAHGYRRIAGHVTDITGVDPSLAGAAGGGALVTTVHDLRRFLDALLHGRLFRRRRTLREMLSFGAATGEGGVTGYGLGLERRVFPGDVEVIGHLGGAPGYFSFVGRLRASDATMAAMWNSEDDPTPLLVPAAQALAAAHG
jgi:D-alanyl-D-alanine carboxypeptidase